MKIHSLFCALLLSSVYTMSLADPTVVPTYAKKFTLAKGFAISSTPTQMAWGPDKRLYVASDSGTVYSYLYNSSTGALSGEKVAVTGIGCLGIGFQGPTMYLSTVDGKIYRLRDENKNGVYGEAKETRVAIVTGIPHGDHNMDNIQISGNTLYVGQGIRTINGRKGDWTGGSFDDYGGKGFWGGGTGKTWGESAYGGTICWIQDLTKVPDVQGAANTYKSPATTQTVIQTDKSPYQTANNKLVVHSAGTRNPFGLALNKAGVLYFTVNFNRANTNGDGTGAFGLHGDLLDSDFSNDVYDQFFKADLGADYGYANDVWRGLAPILNPKATGYHRVNSITYDQLFNKGPYTIYDPNNPKGLGPSSSSDGVSFFYSTHLPKELAGNAFIARYNTSITEAAGGKQRTLTYGDVVAVDTNNGAVRRVLTGFNHALAVLSDGADRLIVADYNPAGAKAGALYVLKAVGP